MSRILLGVSGGIAAYKACELTRLFMKQGHDVIPLVTPGAERFVRAETFAALARRPPAEDTYLHLTRADLLVVAPCTANTLAKLAHGLSDNLLTEAALSHRGPVLVAPAMNPRMWGHPATRANAGALLAEVGPECDEQLPGLLRLAEPPGDVRRRLELHCPGLVALRPLGRDRDGGAVVRNRRREQRDVEVGKRRRGVVHGRGRGRRDHLDPGGSRHRQVRSEEHDVGAAPLRFLRERHAHTS